MIKGKKWILVLMFNLLVVIAMTFVVSKHDVAQANAEDGLSSEFHYVLERTKETLTIKDVELDPIINEIYKTINIQLPNFIVMKNNTLPTNWLMNTKTLDNGDRLYSYQMKGNNSINQIKIFLSTIELSITNENKTGAISIYFKGRTKSINSDTYNQTVDAVGTEWIEEKYKPDFYIENDKYQTHYTFQGTNKNVLSNKVQTYLPNIYIVDKTQKNKIVRHIYGDGESSSSFILGIKTPNRGYQPYSSLYNGAKIYTRVDDDGNKLIKSEVDKTVKVTGLTNPIKYQYRVEMKPTGDDTIQHVYTITNKGQDNLTFIASKNIDTELNNNDAVPVYMYGKNRGLYIMSSPYKLIYDFSNPKGPTQFSNAYSGGWRIKEGFDTSVYYPWNGKTATGTGQEVLNFAPDAVVPTVVAKNDTAIDMKWPEVTLKPGESEEFIYDISLTADYSLKVNYENLREEAEVNRPEDSLKFNYAISKASSISTYKNGELTIPLLKQLTFDYAQGITFYKSNGEVLKKISDVTQDMFNPNTNSLKINISDTEFKNAGPEITISFQASLTLDSENQTLLQKSLSTVLVDGQSIKKENVLTIIVENIEQNENECSALIPQKVAIKIVDTKQNNISKEIVLENQLRVGQEQTFKPTPISFYRYNQLELSNGEVITSEKFVISGEKQEAQAIYTRIGKVNVRQEIVNPSMNVVIPNSGAAFMYNTKTLGLGNQTTYSMNNLTANYTKYVFDIVDTPFFKLIPTVTQFYKSDGYLLTTMNNSHNKNQRVKEFPKWNAETSPEVWVTLYLAPNTDIPTLNSTSYGKLSNVLINTK